MAYEKAHPLGGLSWYLYSIYIVSLGGLLARHIARTHACRVLHPVLVAGGRAASAGISRRTSRRSEAAGLEVRAQCPAHSNPCPAHSNPCRGQEVGAGRGPGETPGAARSLTCRHPAPSAGSLVMPRGGCLCGRLPKLPIGRLDEGTKWPHDCPAPAAPFAATLVFRAAARV
jgi:hypothetical protein